MRTFKLIRNVDNTGISGTGEVAKGFTLFGGLTILTWNGVAKMCDGTVKRIPCYTIHSSVENVVLLHGHSGATLLEYANGERISDIEVIKKVA